MKSAPPEQPDLVNRLRQQLILAQVRIMELEDERDSLTPRLAESELLLRAAQALADSKTDEASHLEKILAEARTQRAQLDQLLRQAGEELTAGRAALAGSTAAVTRRDETIGRLEAELLAIKSSRSWRWTAWLRSSGGKP